MSVGRGRRLHRHRQRGALKLNNCTGESRAVRPRRHGAVNGCFSLRRHAGCHGETHTKYKETANDETDIHEDTPTPRETTSWHVPNGRTLRPLTREEVECRSAENEWGPRSRGGLRAR